MSEIVLALKKKNKKDLSNSSEMDTENSENSFRIVNVNTQKQSRWVKSGFPKHSRGM
jgi:hypothetical protein